MNTYEALFIFSESIKEDDIDEAIKRVKKEVTLLNGTVSGVTRLGKKTFARPLRKQRAGTYSVMNLELEPDKVQVLHDKCKLNEDVFRVQCVHPKSPIQSETKEVEHGIT